MRSCVVAALLLGLAACQKPPASAAQDGLPTPTADPLGSLADPAQAAANGTATASLPSTAPATAAAPPIAPKVACTVNGIPLPLADVDALAAQRGISPHEALLFLIQAETVAQEAHRNAFPAPPGAGRLEVASAYLASLFSEETLCGHIGAAELKALYETAYKPEWPADVYAGQIVELRCCPSQDSPCNTPEQKACMASLDNYLPQFLQMAKRWRSLEQANAADLVEKGSPFLGTDFTFIDWPGIPEEKQTRKRLLDAATRTAIKQLKPGEVSVPLRSSLGLHLVKLTQIRKAITVETPLFQAEGRQYLCRKRILETRQDYVKRLVQYVQVVDQEMKLAP